MRYLTKEWYNLCQKTCLHFGLRAHKEAAVMDEAVYLRLKIRKEKEFLKQEREIYDMDPRVLVMDNGAVWVRADKFVSGEEILEEDTCVYEMPEEQKKEIAKLIEAFDLRGPFDVQKNKIEFEKRHELTMSINESKIPKEVYSQIADPRVFALGYSTKEIIKQLTLISKANRELVDSIGNECSSVQSNENIPENLKKRFGFHDSKIMSIEINQDITIRFDSGVFTEDNRIVFHDAKIIHGEKTVVGCYWLYEELFKTQHGYEGHMLFIDESNSAKELTILCKEITIDQI